MSDQIASPIATYISGTILKQPKRAIKPDEKLISSGLIDSFILSISAYSSKMNSGVRIDDHELNADALIR